VPDPAITKIFNRQVGKILTFLDNGKADSVLKAAVKNQLWFCHDDIQALFDKINDKQDNEDYGNRK